MNNKQYNNVIEKTAKLSDTDMNDSLALTRDTLNNMGVPLPQGELKEVSEILSTDDYMYWRACSAEDAQLFANDGIAAIAVSDSNIAILTAETDNPTTISTDCPAETANVAMVSEVSYYAYSSGGTNTTTYPDITESGDYYCNNKQYGKYLRRLCDVITVSSGTISELQDSIVWRIEKHEDGYYTIRINGTSKYLSTNGNAVRLSVVSGVIPSECKWIRSVNRKGGGGVFFKNVSHQKFLACNSSGLTMKTSVGEIDTATYYSCVWRIANTSYYGNTGTEEKQELTSNFSLDFSDFAVGDIVSPEVDTPNEVLWASAEDFEFSAPSEYIQIDETKHTLKAIKSGNVLITVTHKVTGISKNIPFEIHKAAIIIVPGIMGSILVSGSNSNFPSGTVLWDLSLVDDLQNKRISLSEIKNRIYELLCDSDGSSIANVLALNNNYGTGEIYKPLYDFLQNHFGAMYDVKFFAYDWRLSNEDSAQKLDEFIQNNSFKRVVLVCHSMGGLVASSYLTIGEQQRKSVQKLVMLGSPLLGTSVVPYLWGSENINATGILDSFALNDFWDSVLDFVAFFYNVLDTFIGNFSSLYEMFPSKKYFDPEYANRSYLISSIIGIAPLECTTYAETKIRLEAYLPKYNKTLATKAEQLHDSFYTAYDQHITYKVDSYYIAGYNLDTIDKIETTGLNWSVDSYTTDGDGTVAKWSATLGDKYANKTYFVENVGHIDLINNHNVKTFIKNIINNDTSTSQFDNIFAQ